MATYGDFPGVRVETESGGITSVAIGEEEKLVIFGEAEYELDNSELVVAGDDATLSVKASEPEQIAAPRVADSKFGSDSELASAMKEALGNGANIDFLYGVAVPRVAVEDEIHSSQTGTLDNFPIVEHVGEPVDTELGSLGDMGIKVVDDGAAPDIELRYGGAPETPDDSGTIYVNPLTGEFAAGDPPSVEFEFSYTHNDYSTALGANGPRNVVNEEETGIFLALSESDAVAGDLNTQVQQLRDDYQLVNALQLAEPNNSEVLDDAETTVENGGARARFDAASYASNANNSVSESHFYKFAPSRLDEQEATVGGGIGGLFAGNPIDDPIYNEVVSGYQSLEQQFSKTDADNIRDAGIIPVRSGGSVRVKGNRSTAYEDGNSVATTFWTRRITDRVILVGKQVGDAILGRINNEETRALAERRIEQEMRKLETQRLIQPNTGEENNWNVTAFVDPGNDDEVNIDISFSPYGIVKNVDETITVDTS